MAQVAHLYVAGKYTEGLGITSAPVISPVNGEHLADLPIPLPTELDEAVGAARRAFEEYRHWSVHERAELCHRVARLIEANADELARLTTLEQGKPLAEARTDVADSASLFADSAEDAKRLYGETIPSTARDKRMFTFHAPVGVWAAITPWNFPLMIMCEFVGPALATGNAVVAKPPDLTPLACLALGGILNEAGVPAGLVSILPGGGGVGDALVRHPGIDAIGFVGSSATGERIVRSMGLKRSIMEMSGNGPLVVCVDADIEAAAAAATYGAYWNAGQVCCASERVIVDASVHDEFTAACVRAAGVVRLGDPFLASTTLGPMNNEATASKMDRHVSDAQQRGARLVLGGRRAAHFPTQLYYEYTLLDAVTPDMLVAREESFGPILPIMVGQGDDELLRLANDTELGLQAAVFTRSLTRAFRYGEQLRAGSVVVNESTDYFEGAQPFGGAAGTRTGWGRVGGLAQLRDMTDLRTMIVTLS
jgi:succinate-semialdehyde dehydrogenase/glutarate-semialdehyde dehydrogenase